jgi:hypothetical protein
MNLAGRYGEAYVIARSTINLGQIVKRVGIYGGAAIVVLCLVLSQGGGGYFIALVGIFFGALCIVGGFVAGVIISAQGQIMLAVLDTAVNTSSIATNEEKALALR